MLKIVLLDNSGGMISSRKIEHACHKNILFIGTFNNSAPQVTAIAKYVPEHDEEMDSLFTLVLFTGDTQRLIGRHAFAIDGVKQI